MGHHTVWKTALCDRLLEKSFDIRTGQQIDNGRPSGGLAADRHTVRISAKGGNVDMDPLHCQDLVGKTTV